VLSNDIRKSRSQAQRRSRAACKTGRSLTNGLPSRCIASILAGVVRFFPSVELLYPNMLAIVSFSSKIHL
jgi:hypothetical protein